MFWYCFIAAATQTIIPGTLGLKIICEVYVNNMWEITWLLSFQNIDSTVPSCNGIFCFSSYLWTFVFSISFVTSCTFEWVKPLSHVRLFATPCTVAPQAPLSMGFSRQEYRSGLPFREVCQNSVLGLLFFSIRFPLVTDGTPIASDTITVLFDLNPDLRPYLPALWTGHLHLGIALGMSHCLCTTELTDHLYILLEVFSYTSVICVSLRLAM